MSEREVIAALRCVEIYNDNTNGSGTFSCHDFEEKDSNGALSKTFRRTVEQFSDAAENLLNVLNHDYSDPAVCAAAENLSKFVLPRSLESELSPELKFVLAMTYGGDIRYIAEAREDLDAFHHLAESLGLQVTIKPA